MSTFIVYIRPKENFTAKEFESHLRTYPKWARLQNDFWMISYSGTAVALRDAIGQATQKSCNILVVNISGDGWATLNMDRVLTDWMSENV